MKFITLCVYLILLLLLSACTQRIGYETFRQMGLSTARLE